MDGLRIVGRLTSDSQGLHVLASLHIHLLRIPVSVLLVLALGGELLCQTPLAVLERHWQRGEWDALANWSEERLSEAPDDEMAGWFRLATSLMLGTATWQEVQEAPVNWEGTGSFWEANRSLVEGMRLQALGRHAEALAWFDAYLAFGPKDSPASRIAHQGQTRARHHAAPLASYVPVEPIELRRDPEEEGPVLFDLADSVGRWVKVPEPLRSRFDRKANFRGDMFLSPSSGRAWFASDRTGSGTTDLHEVEILSGGRLGAVRRLPAPINSPYNERTPVFESRSGRLYWSSDRPESVGQFDVFWAELNASLPRAVPLPFAVNSSGDETHYTPTGDGWTAWMVTRRMPDRTPQAVQVLLDGPQHRPVQVELAWDWSDGERALSIWSVDSRRMVWEGTLTGASGVCRWEGMDGASYRALLTDRKGETYTVTEWTLPTTAAPKVFRYRWEEVSLAPVEVGEEPWAGPDALGPRWETIDAPVSARELPVHPVWANDLPERWSELAETPWWRAASVHERWVAVRALQPVGPAMDLPRAPEHGGWQSVPMACAWTADAMEPVIDRLRQTTNALDLICSAKTSDGWEDACAVWSDRIQNDQHILTRGRTWQQLGDQAAGFARLREGMPLQLKQATLQIEWFSDADQIMDRALERAWSTHSWEAILGTEEVWRDWLWAVWQAFRSEENPEESPELLNAWWNLERAFELPIWANLTSAANSLAHLILGPLPPEVFEQPVPQTVIEVPEPQAAVAAHSHPTAALAPESFEPDSVFTVQLGAFQETPDGWAFWGLSDGLRLVNLNQWKKVVYGDYINRNLASEACATLRPFAQFADAFVVGFSGEEWARSRSWHEFRMSGYGVQFDAEPPEAAALAARWPDRFRSWPRGEGKIAVMLGPFWTEPQAWRARAAGGHGGDVLSFPGGKAIEHVPQAHSSAPVPEVEAVTLEADGSVWVVRIAEFPDGASLESRAALMRLPDDLGVRSLPWGGGDAYITRPIHSESEALRVLQAIVEAGFKDARLLSTSSN